MTRFREEYFCTIVPKHILELAARTETWHDVIEIIVELDEVDCRLFFRVQLDGLPDEPDWTWQNA